MKAHSSLQLFLSWRPNVRVLAVLFFILGAAAMSEAQETYSIPANATQVTDLTAVLNSDNVRTCVRANEIAIAAGRTAVPVACTQGQACAGVAAPGGASCTAAQARGANIRIWPITQAGREEYVTFAIIVPVFQDKRAAVPGPYHRARCLFWATASVAQRQTICTDHQLPTTCDLSCN